MSQKCTNIQKLSHKYQKYTLHKANKKNQSKFSKVHAKKNLNSQFKIKVQSKQCYTKPLY